MITIKNLYKSFGKFLVINDINLSMNKGEIIAVMGPNGSGKTTLLKSIVGLVLPEKGEIIVKGENIKKHWKFREVIGYMPQVARYPENLKVKELIELIKDIRGVKEHNDEELIEQFKLSKIFEKPMGTLSGGTKQRVSAVLAFLFNQEILILDEPTASLDPVSAEYMKAKILKEKEKGKLIIISSHIISEIDEIAERMVFLHDGKIHIDSSIHKIKEETKETKLGKAIARLIENYGE